MSTYKRTCSQPNRKELFLRVGYLGEAPCVRVFENTSFVRYDWAYLLDSVILPNLKAFGQLGAANRYITANIQINSSLTLRYCFEVVISRIASSHLEIDWAIP